jgi:hypothetical protein
MFHQNAMTPKLLSFRKVAAAGALLLVFGVPNKILDVARRHKAYLLKQMTDLADKLRDLLD